jgi:hypothetical protein
MTSTATETSDGIWNDLFVIVGYTLKALPAKHNLSLGHFVVTNVTLSIAGTDKDNLVFVGKLKILALPG